MARAEQRMGSEVDQRHVVTARLQLDQPGAAPGNPLDGNPLESNPDDEATDLTLSAVAAEPVLPETGLPEPEPESPWRLNALGIVLLTALICSLAIAVALRVKLGQTRAALSEAESAAEAAESAVARDPAAKDAAEPEPQAAAPVHAAVAKAARAPAPEPEAAAEAPPAAAPHREQLLLLLTVGTQHFAERQLRNLMHKCTAPLAVYRQRRGLCAYSQCFAIAVPASQAEAARGCGRVKGQSLRDRDDFTAP